MKDQVAKRGLRCAIYTRVSTDQGLEQDFNSLDAQREASEAYIKSQAHEGWRLIRDHYDDGGFSGGSMVRPALQKLLIDVQARRIDVIVVYKVDRLTRSLADFAKLVETFDAHGVSFVSVTQSFNTTTSMGRLTLNVLLSFAQFEREVTGEQIRDKIAASKKKGMWMGGVVPLGYRVEDRALHIVEDHAEIVRSLFRRYLEAGSVVRLKQQLDAEAVRLPIRIDGGGRSTGGGLISRGHIYKILSNPIYVGRISHKGQVHEGQQPPIVTQDLWNDVRHRLGDHLGAATAKRTRQSSDALLVGNGDVLLVDPEGDRLYQCPHIYLDFSAHPNNYAGTRKYLSVGEVNIEITDDWKRIDYFKMAAAIIPKTPTPQDQRIIDLDDEIVKAHLNFKRDAEALYAVDDRYDNFQRGDIIPLRGEHNGEKHYFKITHIQKTTIGEYLRHHVRALEASSFAVRQIGRPIEADEILTIVEVDRAYPHQWEEHPQRERRRFRVED